MSGELARALAGSFARVHRGLNPSKIQRRVDQVGIDRFIESCGRFAAVSGGVAGIGGAFTLMVGVPADIANVVAQQFRVTQAVIYHRTGRSAVPYPYFLRIAGLSVDVEHSATGVEALGVAIGSAMAKMLVARGVGLMVPVAGSVVGGLFGYGYIRSRGTKLLALSDEQFRFTQPGEITQ
ncbi:hypothetical protein KZZ52_17095 [Dactylosporangium sp. AC04546]|uniref:hypothetical protein n=1 Tax=Dactylosporangium sp. AC04546 TaxID=2862460 RepID=UPI001EDD0A3D|nr:hypothetical protein [Dactylosporangium sp. AC04546]WVK87017.1 hypothetical protein KZZ52_17095 [Dactylosporangium sp. AC04546]